MEKYKNLKNFFKIIIIFYKKYFIYQKIYNMPFLINCGNKFILIKYIIANFERKFNIAFIYSYIGHDIIHIIKQCTNLTTIQLIEEINKAPWFSNEKINITNNEFDNQQNIIHYCINHLSPLQFIFVPISNIFDWQKTTKGADFYYKAALEYEKYIRKTIDE